MLYVRDHAEEAVKCFQELVDDGVDAPRNEALMKCLEYAKDVETNEQLLTKLIDSAEEFDDWLEEHFG